MTLFNVGFWLLLVKPLGPVQDQLAPSLHVKFNVPLAQTGELLPNVALSTQLEQSNEAPTVSI